MKLHMFCAFEIQRYRIIYNAKFCQILGASRAPRDRVGTFGDPTVYLGASGPPLNSNPGKYLSILYFRLTRNAIYKQRFNFSSRLKAGEGDSVF